MNEEIQKSLYDILNSVKSIEEFLGQSRDYSKFQNNKLVKRTVEREFEIIGEAMNRILKSENRVEIKHSRQIVNLRNHIIHAYDTVLDEILWGHYCKSSSCFEVRSGGTSFGKII